MNAFQWSGGGFNHEFFPLAQGHSTIKCIDCHTTGDFTRLSTDCYSCHQKDFLATTNPNHSASNFPTACSNCHTLSPGWKPAAFNHSVSPYSRTFNTGLHRLPCRRKLYFHYRQIVIPVIPKLCFDNKPESQFSRFPADARHAIRQIPDGSLLHSII